MEKGWRKKFDEAKDRIMDGYRRGVCDKDGKSLKRGGVYIAKPRIMGTSVVKHWCGKCKRWYQSKHVCEGEQK